MKQNLEKVSPIRPFVPYLGGKSRLASQIVPFIENTPHHTYAEPFAGLGGIFFSREHKSKTEALNDISKDIVTFFRVVQRHYQAFGDMLRFQITSRDEFNRLKSLDPESLTDLERAARFFYLQKNNYGGKPGADGGIFRTSKTSRANSNLREIKKKIKAMHERLVGVFIDRLPYADFIGRYDSPATLFYLDPPYFGCENCYGRGIFETADFARLAESLKNISGRFFLSINDTPEIRDIFQDFAIREIKAKYTMDHYAAAQKQSTELLVQNPD